MIYLVKTIPILKKEKQKLIEETKKKKESGTSYNVRQSKIAIGSGRTLGKGLLKATQTRYDFVPEQRTDFIFCTVGEGFGFPGALFDWSVPYSSFSDRNHCGTTTKYFQPLLCIWRSLGILFSYRYQCGHDGWPGTGDRHSLPFISYGGTSLLTFTIMLFILIRLDADRQMVLR